MNNNQKLLINISLGIGIPAYGFAIDSPIKYFLVFISIATIGFGIWEFKKDKN